MTPQRTQLHRLTHDELAELVQNTAEIVESCQRTTAAAAASLRDLVSKLETKAEERS
jgi:hypothetical protein